MWKDEFDTKEPKLVIFIFSPTIYSKHVNILFDFSMEIFTIDAVIGLGIIWVTIHLSIDIIYLILSIFHFILGKSGFVGSTKGKILKTCLCIWLLIGCWSCVKVLWNHVRWKIYINKPFLLLNLAWFFDLWSFHIWFSFED